MATKKTAAPAAPRTDYKAGARVKFNTFSGMDKKTVVERKGFVTKVYATPTGTRITIKESQTQAEFSIRPKHVRGF
jgi:hypothetical protein